MANDCYGAAADEQCTATVSCPPSSPAFVTDHFGTTFTVSYPRIYHFQNVVKELIVFRISSLRLIKQDMDINEVINVAISYESKTFRECSDKVSNHTQLGRLAFVRSLFSKLY